MTPLKKKNRVGRFVLPEIKIFYKAHNNLVFHSSRQTANKWKGQIKSPEIDPCILGHLIYDKDDTAKQLQKENIFNKSARSTRYKYSKKEEKLDPYLTSCPNINSLRGIKLEINNRKINGKISNYMEIKQHTSKWHMDPKMITREI